MKTIIARLSVLVFSFVIASTALNGAVQAANDPLYPESHEYSVVMRGNTESVVYAKINVSNNKETAINKYEFEIPNLKVSDIAGYQVGKDRYCVRYDNSPGRYNDCLRYEEQDYDLSYIPSNATYKKLTPKGADGGKFSVDLPAAVEPGKSTILVLTYIGTGAVRKNTGLYSFNFESIKSANRIKDMKVAVDVDRDFVLKGQKSKVNYNSPEKAALQSGASDLSIGRVAPYIGSEGGVVKTAQNLAANESFSVKGQYAESTWRIHLNKVIIGSIIFIALVAALVFLIRRQAKKPKKPTAIAPASVVPSKTVTAPLWSPLFVLVGLGSTVAVVLGTYGLSVIIESFNDSRNYNDSETISGILLVIIMILFYFLATFGPAIWIAVRRRDWRSFLSVLFWQFAWLIIAAAIYQWGIRGMIDQPQYEEDRPYYDGNMLELRSDVQDGAKIQSN